MTERIFCENSAPDWKGRARVLRAKADEYLCKEKAQVGRAPAIQRHTLIRILSDGWGDFSFGGHRLSSLYRTDRVAPLTLTDSYLAACFS